MALAALPASAPGQVLSFSARSDLVVFSATAVDGKGRPVTDLRREDFRIFEEGRAQPIAHFHGGRGLPARILLLVDASGSMSEERKVANARLGGRPDPRRPGPGGPGGGGRLRQPLLGRRGLHPRPGGRAQGPRRPSRPFGSTALHDALDKAARDIASHGEGRRAVVVLTDGMDTSSQKTPDEVIARSRALDVPIYAVSVVSPLDDPASDSFLGKKEAGEAAAADRDARPLRRALRGRRLPGEQPRGPAPGRRPDRRASSSTSTVSGGTPPSGPSRFRRVVVQSTRKGVTVRTRSGYVPPS